MEIMGFLGPVGTHSEAAAIHLNSILEKKCRLEAFPDIYNAIRAVEKGKIATCLVPVENSLEGSINITLDTLAHCDSLYIAREVVWGVHNHLMMQDVKVPVKKILSHAQPLAQCRDYLREHFPEAELEAVGSTAIAANMAAEADPSEGIAAICTIRAGLLNGLDVVATNIQDNNNNCTRFYQLRRVGDGGDNGLKPIPPEEFGVCLKTQLIFQIDGKDAGQLCWVLQDLATRKVNITRIESRPARTGLGEYIFFLDLDVPEQEYRLDDAIEDICQKSVWLKNPGRYQVSRADRVDLESAVRE